MSQASWALVRIGFHSWQDELRQMNEDKEGRSFSSDSLTLFLGTFKGAFRLEY